MSDPRSLHQRRTHNLLLIQKLLSFRSETSPFTLVLDSVEQGAGGLIREIAKGAKASKTHILYVSYTFHKPPSNIDIFISARRKSPEAVKREITSACSTTKRNLLILSPLNPLLSHPSLHLPTYLLSLLSPTTSLLAIHHHDIPLPPALAPPPHPPYAPSPLTLLTYLATTILTLQSFPQTLAKKRARDRSLREPLFGLAEGKEGLIAGMGGNAYSAGEGMVLEMEHRRKSGRSVHETFFLPSSATPSSETFKGIILLDEHPLFAPPKAAQHGDGGGEVKEEDLGGTFNLGLTEKQRRDREGVVLPYFDAQRRGDGDGGGGGEGGRILYEMGAEDDFDEEEDEI